MSTKNEPKTQTVNTDNTKQEEEKPTKQAMQDSQMEESKFEEEIGKLTTRTQVKRRKARDLAIEYKKQNEQIEQQVVAQSEPITPPAPAPKVEDGEDKEKDGEEDENEAAEDAQEEKAEETKIGRPLTRQEKQDMRRARQQRRREARNRNRQQREQDNEDYKKATEPDYPKMVQCFFHPEEVLVVSENPGENQAYSLNGVVVMAIAGIKLPAGDRRNVIIDICNKKLRPCYFNKDVAPPAVCFTTLSKLEAGIKTVRPLLTKDNPALREPLSFDYKTAYIMWSRWAGKRQKALAEGSWEVWEKVVVEFHPELKDERDAKVLSEGLSPECMDKLRVELMEKSSKYRGSEAWRMLKEIHQINRDAWERQQIAEMTERATLSVTKKTEYIEEVMDGLSELNELVPEAMPSEKHEEREATTEWIRMLVSGKLTTADVAMSWSSLEEFRNNPGREVRSDNPNCTEIGTQLTTYGRDDKPLFRTAIVPVRVVDRDGKLKKSDAGGKFWVPRLVILTAREAWEAMEMRRSIIVGKLKSDPTITDEQAAELCELSQDQHDAWRDGSLAIGKLWTMTLKMRIEKYMAKNPDGPQVRSAIQKRNPRGTHGGFEGGGQQNEASEDETKQFLDGMPVERIGTPIATKLNGTR